MRVSDEDRQLSAKKIEEMILYKNKDELRWDKQVCKKATIKDISPYKFKHFLKLSNLNYNTLFNSLEKLSLVNHDKILNTAVILFGKKPETLFPNSRLRCAVFGTDNTLLTIDMTDFKGDLFYLIDMAEAYVLKNIHIGMRLDGLRRIDVPEINKEALREALINAFCHRDYYKYDSVNVAIFKNRVEIRNPGKLYDGLTIDEIVKGNVSRRRNELIAEMFNKVHYVEKWGKGIELILSKEPDTEFKEIASMFVTVFKRKDVAKIGKTTQKIIGLLKENPNITRKELSEMVGSKLVETVGSKLVENQLKIILLIQEKPEITKKELSEILNISTTAIDKNIQKLKKLNIIKRVGSDKGGYFVVVSKTTPKIEDMIFEIVNDNPNISKDELAQKLNMTSDGIKYHIRKMKKSGIIQWMGPSKSGYWKVV